MKVIVLVYEDDEWHRDTLRSKMVDTRIEKMVAEFAFNDVPIQVIRQKEEDVESLEVGLNKKFSEILIEISKKLGKRGFMLSAKHFETVSKMVKDYNLDEVVSRVD